MHLRRRLTRRPLALGAAALLAGAGLAVSLQTPAAAATGTMTATGTYDAQDSTRFQSHGVTGSDGGQYVIQTNLWNKAVSGGYNVNWNDQSTAWTLTNNTANSYFPEVAGSTAAGNTEPTEAGFTCSTANGGNDPLDTGCHWAGHGDPYVNPTTGAQDQFATTSTMPAFVPQQPPAGSGTHVVGLTNEFSNQIHAPASYADIFLGCHWGNCTPGKTAVIPAGAPFPLQYTGVSRLDSVWNITVPTDGVYDAAYDIWLDSNTRNCPVEGQACQSPPATMPLLPTEPTQLNNPGQNDGAEVMIWVGHNGYTITPAGQKPVAGTIQPAGNQLNLDANGNVVPVTIPGIDNQNGTQATFDVWGGRSRSFDNGIRWNVITFVNRNPVRSGFIMTPGLSNAQAFDGKAFIDYAATLGNQCSVNTNNTPLPPETVNCLDPHWWLTSVQAGYEIWNLPSGDTMATNNFSVQPVAVSGGVDTGNRSCPAGGCAPSAPAGTPLINWMDTFNVVAQGCPNATNPTWKINATNFIDGNNPVANFTYPTAAEVANGLGKLVEQPAGSGNYISVPQAGPLNDPANGYVLHDVAQITISMTCNGVVKTSVGTVFIDPSGEVLDLNGKPVQGAQVTLLRSATQAGPFTPVANGDTTVMSPANTANPSTTDSAGRFRWDVVTGWYEVSATKTGCTGVGGTNTSAPEHVLPPPASPVTAIKLTLDCGGGLPTTVVVRPPGVTQFGYCADITVTNNTNAPVVWNTHFVIPGGQTINQHWNMVLTQVGNQAVNVHADPSNPWNAVLQPGQSTTSTGFCAVP